MAEEDILGQDREYMLSQVGDTWNDLRGARIFLTGGTGFFGCWLLEALLYANDRLALGTEVVALSRSPGSFAQKMPHLAENRALTLHQGDIRSFDFPEGPFTHVIHAATDTATRSSTEQALQMVDTIVEGTRRALEFARKTGVGRFLYISSGAVYGRQPSGTEFVSEEYTGGPDTAALSAAYAEGKRLAETLCHIFSGDYGLEVVIARCFAFLGPYLPLDAHFAVGNFIRDGLKGHTIRIAGDGTPYRSYLYGADLAIWLWILLLRGQARRVYNVGADEAVTILELAHAVAESFLPRPVTVEVARQPDFSRPAERYVPSIERAKTELGLTPGISLRKGIQRTIAWNRTGVLIA